MSIRPVNFDELPDMSFEDIDTTLNKVDVHKSYSKKTNKKKLEIKSKGELSPVHKNKHLNGITTPSLTASSEGTTFSNHDRKFSIDSKTDDDNFDGISDKIKIDNEFFNDFEEFQNAKDGFDEALKIHFKLDNSSPVIDDNDDVDEEDEEYANDDYGNGDDNCNKNDMYGVMGRDSRNTEMDILSSRFDKALNWNSQDTNLNNNRQLRKPSSMMELKPYGLTRYHRTNSKETNRHNLQGSKSSSNLRARKNGTMQIKKSMPSLDSRYRLSDTYNNEEAYPSKGYTHNVGLDRKTFNSNFETNQRLSTFEEESFDDNDEDFFFNENFIKPQFSNNPNLIKNRIRSPTRISISPSQYDIVQDETLLTPSLKKRQKEWNNRSEQLKTFKEYGVNQREQNRVKFPNAVNRIKTIKQEIDHNTPIKKGKMYYNPKTLNWEGNDKILDKFQVIKDNEKKRPILIRSKSPDKTTKNKVSSVNINNDNPRIVGKMMFDEANLRWVSLNEYENDPFQNIPDFKIPPKSYSNNNGINGSTLSLRKKESIANLSPFLRSQSHRVETSNNAEKMSRFYSAGTYSSHFSSEELSAFQISSKIIEKFYHEENKWVNEINGWMTLNKNAESDLESHLDVTQELNINKNKYMYEIRNMVLNSSRG
ncbi:hypothetical protein TPHA_0O00530 [Tetrapisispora phaffii CBS 4417]|uniref:Mitotic check point protein BFA1 n=1 Tax=Tetrapisispora phaffii (strain ATCC 24235 / CBS 4417 / NBRC 1672 / NRRL Y-8282 / UCD 70-5) TaxID=1071381 RepID=G8C1J5_TETPH|nr:hypothetical protein TPHA_0O00530 [Tetrapisispora phaffii CBS 4417]CCE66023.1 hypothetical protein TPHA_0O00530 [Tetrapisispora phaffii CBS 4417]